VSAEVEHKGFKDFPLFRKLAPAEVEQLEKLCRFKRYKSQEQIIDRQSESREVFFVVSGRVRIVIYSLSGREITLDDLCAGGYFGELAALDSEPRSASVMALEDTVTASMPHETFLNVLDRHPEVARNVMLRLTAIIRQATERIMDLSTLGANNRVHAEILRQARLAGEDEDGRAWIAPIPVHSDVASRVSTTRETVARVFSDLTKSGLLVREKDALLVTDLFRLEDLVEEVRGE